MAPRGSVRVAGGSPPNFFFFFPPFAPPTHPQWSKGQRLGARKRSGRARPLDLRAEAKRAGKPTPRARASLRHRRESGRTGSGWSAVAFGFGRTAPTLDTESGPVSGNREGKKVGVGTGPDRIRIAPPLQWAVCCVCRSGLPVCRCFRICLDGRRRNGPTLGQVPRRLAGIPQKTTKSPGVHKNAN